MPITIKEGQTWRIETIEETPWVDPKTKARFILNDIAITDYNIHAITGSVVMYTMTDVTVSPYMSNEIKLGLVKELAEFLEGQEAEEVTE